MSVKITGEKPTESSSRAGGAVHDDRKHRRSFYYGGDSLTALGAGLRWAAVQKVDELHVAFTPSIAGDAARRASLLEPSFPVNIWEIGDSQFHPASIRPLTPPPELGPDFTRFAKLVTQAGAKPVVDYGRMVAEVAGLEVARLEQIETENGTDITAHVGVGQADRELQQLLSNLDPNSANDGSDPDEDFVAKLTKVVATISKMRLETPDHPLSRISGQRRIRSNLLESPDLVDAVELVAVPQLRPITSVLDTASVAAVGRTTAGDPIVVVCSVGVDLDLAAEVADYRHRFDPQARAIVVVPARDVYLVEPIVSSSLPDVPVLETPPNR